MDISAYIDIPIVVITYIVMEIIKRIFLKSDESRNLIPVISPVVGSIISIFIFCVFPEMSTNINLLSAFTSGAISGAAATGSNQIYKKISNFFMG